MTMIIASPFRLCSCPSALSFSRSHLFSTPLCRPSFCASSPASHFSNLCCRASSNFQFLSMKALKSSSSRLVTRARRTFLSELQEIREEKNVASTLEYESPLKIVLYPDQRLRANNKQIVVFDEKLAKFVKEMFEVMYKTDGVGLSAPQVGVNVRLMVFNPEGERGKGEEIVLINPKIFKYSNKRSLYTEGCLSFPQLEGDVERPVSVKIEAQDIRGKKFDIQLKGFQARIFQHEYDHLQSTLFFERMAPDVLESIIPALQKLEKDYEQKTGRPSPESICSKK